MRDYYKYDRAKRYSKRFVVVAAACPETWEGSLDVHLVTDEETEAKAYVKELEKKGERRVHIVEGQ